MRCDSFAAALLSSVPCFAGGILGVEDPKDRGMLRKVPQAKTAETPLHIAKPPSKKETELRALATELGYSLTPSLQTLQSMCQAGSGDGRLPAT